MVAVIFHMRSCASIIKVISTSAVTTTVTCIIDCTIGAIINDEDKCDGERTVICDSTADDAARNGDV